MLIQVLEITAPVFLLAFVGFVWAKSGQPFDTEFVTRLVVTIGTPALIFVVLATAKIEPQAFRDMALAALAVYGALGAVLWAVLRLAGVGMRSFLAPLIFSNTGNLGLPVALFAYGEAGLALAVVFFAVTAILQFTVGVWLMSGGGSMRPALKQPMVYAAILGGVFLTLGWGLPVWAENTLRLTGQMVIPMMLITLGISISRLRPGALGLAVGLSVVKLAVGGGAAVLAVWLLALEGAEAGVLILQAIMPVAVTSYLLAVRYKADADAVAGLVISSTLISVAAIPAVLSLIL